MHQGAKALSCHLEVSCTTSCVFDRNWDEVQTNGQNDQACDQWWKHKAQFLNHAAECEVDNTGNQTGGEHDAQALGCGNTGQNANKCKACTLHNRQTGANWAHANGLKQCGNTCKQHSHLNQINLLSPTEGKPCGAGYNNCWSYV